MNAGDIPAGFYPERDTAPESVGDRAWSSAVFWVHQRFHRRIADPARLAGEVARHAGEARDGPLDARVPNLRFRLRRAPLSGDLLAECFGLYCAALRRGDAPAATPSPAVLGAARILVDGGIVELAAIDDRHGALALAAAAMALRGTPVHLLTASEPRACVLAEVLRTPFAALGIGVGLVTAATAGRARYAAYCNLVVCGVSREIGVDYLRDRITLGGRPRQILGTLDRLSGDAPADQKPFLPGMRCALVEEADQVMLDDSRVPLAVSTEADPSSERLTYEQALELARVLREPADFSPGPERTELTPEGSRRLAQLTQALGGVWAGREGREELIALALDALHFAQRDRDYRVLQGRVVFPPRPAEEGEEPDAAQQLLQKLVEVKEGCRLSGRRVVLAQISVPRVLGRYLHLAGICGDARGLEHEFWRLYRMKTTRADDYPQALRWRARLFATAAEKRSALMACVRSPGGGAVVIALRSPAEAQALLDAFAAAGIKAGLVRGTGDAAEKQAVADLDTPGAAIVTLYPAERTVIRAAVNAVPPHLIVAELHDAGRHITHIARAYGAASCEILVSLEDEALKVHLGPRAMAAAARAAEPGGEALPDRARRWVSRALRNAERAVTLIRRDAESVERHLDDLLAFSGQRE